MNLNGFGASLRLPYGPVVGGFLPIMVFSIVGDAKFFSFITFSVTLSRD
jgi:hypothetical protein